MAENTPIYLEEFMGLHPADLADRLQRLPVDQARHYLQELPVETASAALAEMEEELLPELLKDFPQAKLVPLLNLMPAEDCRRAWRNSRGGQGAPAAQHG